MDKKPVKYQLVRVVGGCMLYDTDHPIVDRCRVVGKIYSEVEAESIVDACNRSDDMQRLLQDLSSALQSGTLNASAIRSLLDQSRVALSPGAENVPFEK